MQSAIGLENQGRSEPTPDLSHGHESLRWHGFRGDADLDGLVQVTVAVVTAGAALIHFVVIQEHWEEYWLFGLFFAVVGCLQTLGAFVVLARPSREAYGAIALGSMALIALWWWSRVVGMPIGPDRGMLEEARLIDIVSTEFEVVGLIGALMLMWPALLGRRVRAWAVSLASVAASAGVMSITLVAILSIRGD